jgi:hypothetical protein
MLEQLHIDGMENPEDAKYQAFVDKFKPKKTTDDCHTPENVYNAVADWVQSEYGISKKIFVGFILYLFTVFLNNFLDFLKNF